MPTKKKEVKKISAFRLSLAKVTIKQVVLIIVILACFAAIPFVVYYIKSPDKVSIEESISNTLQNLKFKNEETNQPFMVKLPLTNTEVNLTIVKQNPQLISYFGIGCVSVSLIVGITLLRDMRK
jgi:hypothetical protein